MPPALRNPSSAPTLPGARHTRGPALIGSWRRLRELGDAFSASLRVLTLVKVVRNPVRDFRRDLDALHNDAELISKCLLADVTVAAGTATVSATVVDVPFFISAVNRQPHRPQVSRPMNACRGRSDRARGLPPNTACTCLNISWVTRARENPDVAWLTRGSHPLNRIAEHPMDLRFGHPAVAAGSGAGRFRTPCALRLEESIRHVRCGAWCDCSRESALARRQDSNLQPPA